MKTTRTLASTFLAASLTIVTLLQPGQAAPLPGGTLDPTTIPKYVIPLVYPPVMKNNGQNRNDYHIALRQFQQQILPGGPWNAVSGREDNFPATTVWSYGPAYDPLPEVAPDPSSGFNYPAYTIETLANLPVSVKWINGLVDENGDYLPHLLPIDQTIHWANPPATDCKDGSNRTDCGTNNPETYTGPVPMVTHVHGAHVQPHSDGYPEAWWLPAARNIPAGYETKGGFFSDATGTNPGNLGYAYYWYRNNQPATTLWYHDHTLGITRNNVYAGPAGYWLIRGGPYDWALNGETGGKAVLPGPAPQRGQTVDQLNDPDNPTRQRVRELPILIQDRSFNADGSLFYPDSRNFQGFNGNFAGPYTPEITVDGEVSDVPPIWIGQAFFNTMVVNGATWPYMEVAPARYRVRFLNGSNSRTLNLALLVNPTDDTSGGSEMPIIQIGADQGFLSHPVEVITGFATPLPGNGHVPTPDERVPAPSPKQALLVGPAERVDAILDFTGLPEGTIVRLINTGPDGGFSSFADPGLTLADPGTTGQVMQFVVNDSLLQKSDASTTSPYSLQPQAEGPLDAPNVTRQVSLGAVSSETTCWNRPVDGTNVNVSCEEPGVGHVRPQAALLGVLDLSDPTAPKDVPLRWTDTTGASTDVPVQLQDGTVLTVPVTENPILGDTEVWEIYNFTQGSHPIHLHLVRFEIINRQEFNSSTGEIGNIIPTEPGETGYKDTVMAYPNAITRVKAKFDVQGLYVWHCHILEHEDNEMMRPYVVSAPE